MTRLRQAAATTAAIAVWIHVQRRTGASGPPMAAIRAQTTKMTGSTSRSNLRSIGSENVSWIVLKGTSQTTAIMAASIHGRMRVVRGQSPARFTRGRGTPSKRSRSAVRSKGRRPRGLGSTYPGARGATRSAGGGTDGTLTPRGRLRRRGALLGLVGGSRAPPAAHAGEEEHGAGREGEDE